MKKGQKNLSLGNEHAHVCPLMCICVAVHTFGSIFVSLRLLVRFYLLVSVEGGRDSSCWSEISVRSEEHMMSRHQEDHWAVICVTNWKNKVITLLKITALPSFSERILKFRGFYETVV